MYDTAEASSWHILSTPCHHPIRSLGSRPRGLADPKLRLLRPRHNSGKVREQERRDSGRGRGHIGKLQGNQVLGTEPSKGTRKTMLL